MPEHFSGTIDRVSYQIYISIMNMHHHTFLEMMHTLQHAGLRIEMLGYSSYKIYYQSTQQLIDALTILQRNGFALGWGNTTYTTEVVSIIV